MWARELRYLRPRTKRYRNIWNYKLWFVYSYQVYGGRNAPTPVFIEIIFWITYIKRKSNIVKESYTSVVLKKIVNFVIFSCVIVLRRSFLRRRFYLYRRKTVDSHVRCMEIWIFVGRSKAKNPYYGRRVVLISLYDLSIFFFFFLVCKHGISNWNTYSKRRCCFEPF